MRPDQLTPVRHTYLFLVTMIPGALLACPTSIVGKADQDGWAVEEST